MRILAVYYSKSGNTKAVAERLRSSLNCELDEISYDENTKTVTSFVNPSEYEHIILLCPIWAFSLCEPMKIWLNIHKEAIKSYSLCVTCGGIGLSGCVRGCKSILGIPPVAAWKIKAKNIKADEYSLSQISDMIKSLKP